MTPSSLSKTPGKALVGRPGVYVITNVVTGTVYVGSTLDFKTRWATHLRLLRRGKHHSWKLQRAFDTYGEASFTFRPLLICAKADLAFFEQRALVAYDAVETGYNVSADTEAPMRGRKHSEATKAKLSKIQKGIQAQRTTQPFAGKSHSEDTRAKMSAARKGVPKSEAHKAALAAAHTGKTHSEAAKALIRRAWELRRLTPVSAETRKKLSEAGKGKPVSEKSRQALIERNKASAGVKTGPMNLSDAERQRRIDANKARTGKVFEGEQAEVLKAKKQAAWAERKAKGLHTRRWYVNRGLEVPPELSTLEPPCEAAASASTSVPTPKE